MLILLSGGRNRRDYELEMAQLRSGERSHITSEDQGGVSRGVRPSDGYVTPTEIHCPLCGQVRKSPDNGSGSLIIRHLKLEHVLKKQFNTENDLEKIKKLEELLRVRRQQK